jgi:hypothetical protein
VIHAAIECSDGGGRGECASDLVNVGLAAATLGLGPSGVSGALARTTQLAELAAPAQMYSDMFGVLSNAYGAVSWAVQSSPGDGC